MTYNYMQVMSEEEVEQHHKEIEEWWSKLDWEIKNHVRVLIGPLVTKINCDHEWVDPSTYENELDKSLIYCSACGSTKPKKWWAEAHKKKK